MAIPKQHELYEQIFRLLADGNAYTLTEIELAMGSKFNLNETEKQQLKGSGTQRLMNNRCGWATWRLSQPSLVVRIERGTYQMTSTGQARAKNNMPLTKSELFDVVESSESTSKNSSELHVSVAEEASVNPEENIEESYRVLRLKLTEDLLIEIKQRKPEFFEQLVVRLMIAMGYGGSRQEAGRAIGRSGDGGIDGIINEDRLGLDAIYLQAKRWDGNVGRPDIQAFVGALQGQRAHKGVFITTSAFTKEALEYVKNIQNKVVLIDGRRLAELMIEYNLGVSTVETYAIKRIDSDFFAED